jgi:4-hydroxybenzoate polyprenyltransferase
MKYINFKQFIILSRPLLFPVLLLCLFVALLFSTSISNITYLHIIEIFLISLLTPFLIFAINDIYDYNSDKVNGRKKDIIQGSTFKNIYEFKKSIKFYDLIIIIFLLFF